MDTEPAKHILQTVRDTNAFFPRDYNMNLYRGCSHGCVYCDGRSACYHVNDFSRVRVKANALAILRSELRAKKTPGIAGLGGMSDGYNPFEEALEVTRGALKLLLESGFGIGVTTKGALVARDADLLCAIRKTAVSYVTFSITANRDETSRVLEPGAPTSSARFLAMEALSRAGVPTGVWINPMLPFLTDDETGMRALLRRTKDAGGQYALCHFELTLREGNREYFYQALDKNYPGLKARYARAYANAYVLPVPEARALAGAFREECERLKLKYRFPEVHDFLKTSGGYTQLSF